MHNLGYWQQFSLQLVSPIIGTVIIGTVAAWLARRYQSLREDRDVETRRRSEERELQMELLERLSDIAYIMHIELSFYERWVRHAEPPVDELETRRRQVDRTFIVQRARLGAFQTEIDAHYGRSSAPKQRVHQLTDVVMLRYALILGLPKSQVDELVAHVGAPDHIGISAGKLKSLMQESVKGPEMPPILVTLDKKFAEALGLSMHSLLSTQLARDCEGFTSGKLLTAYDQRPANEASS